MDDNSMQFTIHKTMKSNWLTLLWLQMSSRFACLWTVVRCVFSSQCGYLEQFTWQRTHVPEYGHTFLVAVSTSTYQWNWTHGKRIKNNRRETAIQIFSSGSALTAWSQLSVTHARRWSHVLICIWKVVFVIWSNKHKLSSTALHPTSWW